MFRPCGHLGRAIGIAAAGLLGLALSGCLIAEHPVIVEGTRIDGLPGRYQAQTDEKGELVIVEAVEPMTGAAAYRVDLLGPDSDDVEDVVWLVVDIPRADGRALAQYRFAGDGDEAAPGEVGFLLLDWPDPDTIVVLILNAATLTESHQDLLKARDVTVERSNGMIAGLSVKLKGQPDDILAVLRALSLEADEDMPLVLTRVQ